MTCLCFWAPLARPEKRAHRALASTITSPVALPRARGFLSLFLSPKKKKQFWFSVFIRPKKLIILRIKSDRGNGKRQPVTTKSYGAELDEDRRERRARGGDGAVDDEDDGVDGAVRGPAAVAAGRRRAARRLPAGKPRQR